MGNFAPQKPEIVPIGHHRKVLLRVYIFLPYRKRQATDAPLFVKYRAAWGRRSKVKIEVIRPF